MANTYVDYTAVASQTDYNFSFEYLRDEHVKVKVDDVIVTNYTIVTSPVQLIRFNTAPTASATIKIYRDSRGDFSPLVDFVDGSVLTENELDESYKHNLFVSQEASEGTGNQLLTKKDTNDYDAEGNKIINLGTPTASTDAANKGYTDQTIDNAIALGGSPAIVSLGGYDVTAFGTSITKSLANWTNDLNSPTATGSTTPRTLTDRFADVINVLDYGADNTGVTDSSTAFTNAITAAGSNGVVICDGTFQIDSTVTLASGVTLRSNSSAELVFGSSADFELSGDNNVENIVFNLNGTGRQVTGETISNVTFKNCTAKNSTNNGFYFNVGCSKITFENCTSNNNTKQGFYISGTETNAPNRIQLINCKAFNNGENGISVNGVGEITSQQTANYASHVLISGCITNNNGNGGSYNGISFPYCRYVSIVNCISFSNQEHGISTQETSKFSVSACVCYLNGQAGFNAQSGYDPFNAAEEGVISNCNFFNNRAGVFLKEICENLIFSANSMLDNDEYSFRLVDISSSGLKSNQIILIGNDLHPTDYRSFVNSNDSTAISSPDQLNSRGQPLMVNRAITEDISSALTIDTAGSLNDYPEVFFITDSGTSVSRSVQSEAIKGRRIILMADGSGNVSIRHNQGDTTGDPKYAGFVLSAGATTLLGAYESITFLGNGSDWIETAKNA
jgi:hypothetical protein